MIKQTKTKQTNKKTRRHVNKLLFFLCNQLIKTSLN